LQSGQGIQGFLQNTRSFDTLVGDDQGLVNANPLALLFQELNGAEVDLNLGDVIDECHGF
jgi:hypothetical protein